MKRLHSTDERTREWIPIAQMELPPNAQRGFKPAHAAKIAAAFDPGLLGYPVVAKIPGRGGRERYWIIDGQHRIAAVREALGEDQSVECEVIHNITLQRAAQLFRGRNDKLGVRPLDKFIAGVTAGDPECVAINDTVASLGLRIVNGNVAKNQVSAVTALQKIHRLDPKNGLLKDTLHLAIEAWGRDAENFNGDVLQGLGMVLHRYNDELEKNILERKLKTCPGGALGLLGKGRMLRQAMSYTTVSNGIACAVVRMYNTGRRKAPLTEWGAQ